MNIRSRIAAVVAGSAVISSLAVGFATQPASASVCETQTTREVYASDVKVTEGNPFGSTIAGNVTKMEFTVHTFGCLTAVAMPWEVRADNVVPGADVADNDDYQHPTNSYPKGTLTWGDGDSTPRKVSVFIWRDTKPEADETLALYRGWAKGMSIPFGHVAVGWIVDDDMSVPR
ncbi:MAG: hypothetical protein ACRD12_17100 [Acidimicrobiales bacterium]